MTYSVKDIPHPDDIVRVMEVLCCWDAFTREESIPRSDDVLSSIHQKIKTMLALVFSIFPRKEGNNWNLSKVHELRHVSEFIKEYGVCRNWNTEVGEKIHKWHAKAPAANAQKRKEDVYLSQVGLQIDNLALVEHARRCSGMASMLPINPPLSEPWYVVGEHNGVIKKNLLTREE